MFQVEFGEGCASGEVVPVGEVWFFLCQCQNGRLGGSEYRLFHSKNSIARRVYGSTSSFISGQSSITSLRSSFSPPRPKLSICTSLHLRYFSGSAFFMVSSSICDQLYIVNC